MGRNFMGVVLRIKFMSLHCETVFRNPKAGIVKLWMPLIQIP
jgi:hypothetical protein